MKIYAFQSGNRTGFKFRFGFTPNSQGSNLSPAGLPWTLASELDIGAAGGLTAKTPGVGNILDDIQTKGFHLGNVKPVI